ncbi:MAG TPA: hypothetical protein VK809_08490 [Bacteroidia bacterium]|jgi:hypothetical protein|nr:hypothetical protein [Bacteroidia bacterium]
MKSKLKPLFLILLSFLLFSFVGNKHKNDLDKYHLKGRVKTCTEFYYYNNSGTQKNKLSSRDVDDYNSKGYLIAVSSYFGKSDTILEKWTYLYNNRDKMIEEKGYGYNNRLTYTRRYNCDSNWVKLFSIDSIVDDWKTFYKYDTKGNMIEEGCYKNNMAFNEKFIYQYDALDNLIEEDDYLYNKDSLTQKLFYKHDTNGNEIERSGGHPCDRYTCKYENFDKEGNWLREIKISKDNIPEETIIERVIEYYP